MTEAERAELAAIIGESVQEYLEAVGRGEMPVDITWHAAGMVAARKLESMDFYYLPRKLRSEL